MKLDELGPDGEPMRMRWAGLAENPVAPEELLAVLATSDSRRVHLTLANREDLPDTVGETLADRSRATGDEHLIRPLAYKDQLPERVLLELMVSADPAVRAAAAVAPGLRRDLVVSLIDDPEPEVRRGLTFRAGLDVALRERLANDPDPDVRESLGYQHDLQDSILEILARDPIPAVRVQVISSLARRWLPEVVDDSDPTVRSEVARHPGAGAYLLDRLSRDEDSLVRLSVCLARRVSAKLLTVLATDSDPHVRAAVASEGKTPDDVVRKLADDSDANVRMKAQMRLAASRDPRSFEEVERQTADGTVGWVYPAEITPDRLNQFASSQQKQLRIYAAGKRPMPADLARTLAHDLSPGVRATLAGNDTAPAEVLRLLVGDTAREVRSRLAENFSAPGDVLAQVLAAQPDHETRLAVAINPNTPPAVLAELAQGDHEPDVLREACVNSALPHETMWALVAPLTATGTAG